jgi:hypothetical protein
MNYLWILLFLMTGSCWALGPGAGPGVQVCGNEVTLYSFFEGGHSLLHNISIWKDDPRISRDEYIERALTTLYDRELKIADDMKAKIDFLRKELPNRYLDFFPELPQTFDIPMLESGCEFRSIILRDSFGRTFFHHKLFNKLSPMGQAGLLFEEALSLLHIEIESPASMADVIRRMTAMSFSDSKIKMNKEGRCTVMIEHIKPQLELYTRIFTMCKEGREPEVLETYDRIKKLMRETADECIQLCEEGSRSLRICHDFSNFLDKPTHCDKRE